MELNKIIECYTHNIVDESLNKWEVIEVSDIEEVCKEYHKKQLSLLNSSLQLPSEEEKDIKIKELLKRFENDLTQVNKNVLKSGFNSCYFWFKTMIEVKR